MKTIFSIQEVNTFSLKGEPVNLKFHEYETEEQAQAEVQMLRDELKKEYSTAQSGFKTPPYGYQVAPIRVNNDYKANDRYRK